MDKKIANNVIVGVVVTIGFMGFLFVMFNIGGGDGFFSSRYTLYAKFAHVKGLHYGSEVSLSGLRIGVVKDIAVAVDNPKELVIELAIARNMQDKIRADSTAAIKTQGMLGDKYVEVTIGSPDQPVLKSSSFLQVAEEQDLFTKGGSLVEELKRHFEKGGEIESLIKNLNTLSGNLAQMSGDIKTNKGLANALVYGQSGAKLSQAMTHFNEILRKVDEGEGSLGALVNDPTVYEDLKSMMGGAKRSSILKYFMRSFIESGQDKQDPKEKR